MRIYFIKNFKETARLIQINVIKLFGILLIRLGKMLTQIIEDLRGAIDKLETHQTKHLLRMLNFFFFSCTGSCKWAVRL